MEETNALIHDLSDAEAHTVTLESETKELADDLENLDEGLEISEQVNKALKNLNATLTSVQEMLATVSIVPEIEEEAESLKATLEAFQVPLEKALEVSNELEETLEPIRTGVDLLVAGLQTTDLLLVATMNAENGAISTFGKAQTCIQSQPDSPKKTSLQAQLEAASANLDPTVIRFDAAQTTLLAGFSIINSALAQIQSWTSALTTLLAEINHVMSVLKPLVTPLKALKKGLSHVIRVPYLGYPKFCEKIIPCGWHTVYFSFSVEHILKGVSGVLKPVEDLLEKALGVFLKPLLKALHLNITLPAIDGLDVLETMETQVSSEYNLIQTGVENLAANATIIKAISVSMAASEAVVESLECSSL